MHRLSRFIKKYNKFVTFFASIATIFALVFSIFTYNRTQDTGYETNNYFNGDINGDYYAGNVLIYQYGTNTATGDLENAFSYEPSEINTIETQLLSLAKQKFDNGEYMEALRIYSDPALKDNVYAKINQAYFYAHGCGVKADHETAKRLYDSIENCDDARRNRLALLIVMNQIDHAYDEEIIEELNYFVDIQDYDVLNYISLCKYRKMWISLTPEERNSEIQLSDIYHYKTIDVSYFPTALPIGYCGFEKRVFVGATCGVTANGSATIYYNYILCGLENIEVLDCIYG